MKKLPLLLIVVALFSIFLISGCGNTNPAEPEATATPVSTPTSTPVIAAAGATFDDFSDGDLTCSIGAVTGTWSYGNDSATGGTSSVTSFGIINDSDIQLGVTATVETSIPISGGGFAAQVPSNTYGYVYIQLDLSGPVNLTANNSNGIGFYIYETTSVYPACRVYVYDGAGRSCWNPTFLSITPARTSNAVGFTAMTVSAAAAYTAADILAQATKIQIVIKKTGYNFTSSQPCVIIDGVGVY